MTVFPNGMTFPRVHFCGYEQYFVSCMAESVKTGTLKGLAVLLSIK